MLATSTAALAAELKTITLSVDKMTCNMCPITVKKALRKLDGVSEVSAKYEGDGIGWAMVTYDPAKVKIEDLTFATEQAGYPSRLKQ
ncbi:MAG: mercuric transport protein periplasmic component [Gammaproteobacteria bacterium]|nr:mercuric transport protein periplasmic component [Gammaproteobacteria bacterium]